MRGLVFDTETTGLPAKGCKGPTPQNLDTYPSIVQFSFIYFDSDDDRAFEEHDYILHAAMPISAESTEIHGITEARSAKCGFTFPDVFGIFAVFLERADVVVAHNVDFDYKMLAAECLRHGIPLSKHPMNLYCTMRKTIDFCDLTSPLGFTKQPKLSELYHKLFGEVPTDLHNSLTDARACLRCFFAFQLKRDLPPSVVKRIS